MESEKEVKAAKKAEINKKESESREDWEGGASRPAEEGAPAVAVIPPEALPENLQAQAEKAPKAVSGDYGPPKNLQSIPTQNTHEISAEEEAANKIKKNPLNR